MRLPLPGVLCALLMSPVGLTAQPDSTRAFAEAVPAMEAWLALVDARRYGESWAAASEPFRRSIARGQWEEAGAAVRGPYEPFGTRTLRLRRYATGLPGAPPGRYVILEYRTATPRGVVTETVVAGAAPDGRWLVGGYFVREGEAGLLAP